MPYAQEVRPGQMIRRERSADVMHVEESFPTDGNWWMIVGHSPVDGRKMTAHHSENRWMLEVIPSGSTVRYHGSLINHHGEYQSELCVCPDCDNFAPWGGPKFHLTGASVELQHASRQSITVLSVCCGHCATIIDAPNGRPSPNSEEQNPA